MLQYEKHKGKGKEQCCPDHARHDRGGMVLTGRNPLCKIEGVDRSFPLIFSDLRANFKHLRASKVPRGTWTCVLII
jgi:hypothetical protein